MISLFYLANAIFPVSHYYSYGNEQIFHTTLQSIFRKTERNCETILKKMNRVQRTQIKVNSLKSSKTARREKKMNFYSRKLNVKIHEMELNSRHSTPCSVLIIFGGFVNSNRFIRNNLWMRLMSPTLWLHRFVCTHKGRTKSIVFLLWKTCLLCFFQKKETKSPKNSPSYVFCWRNQQTIAFFDIRFSRNRVQGTSEYKKSANNIYLYEFATECNEASFCIVILSMYFIILHAFVLNEAQTIKIISWAYFRN